MLIIGDVHINTRMQHRIIDTIRDFCDRFSDEKHIVFVGDFMYHFSYDRQALLELYELFVSLFSQRKNVYVLAGNHDRLGNSFLYEEGKKAFDIINNTHPNKLHFITEPETHVIEGQTIFFLPYMIDNAFLEKDLCSPSPFVKGPVPSGVGQGDSTNLFSAINPIQEQIAILEQSTNRQEKLSAMINRIAYDAIQQHKDLLIIHHYYINKTVFPGQKSQFAFKDVALSEHFLDMTNVKMISGHLHQSFTHKNYLCTGSIRHTSSLENNHIKYLFRYNIEKKEVFAYPYLINPYIVCDYTSQTIDQDMLQKYVDAVLSQTEKNILTSQQRNINLEKVQRIDRNCIHVSIKTPQINYEEMHTYISDELRGHLADVQLKKISMQADLDNTIDMLQSQQRETFADWKAMLKIYLQHKYGQEFDAYDTFLKDLRVW